jgi:N-acetylglucosaminyl-diphospho-decaprenol L-rhamnosyltransferase
MTPFDAAMTSDIRPDDVPRRDVQLVVVVLTYGAGDKVTGLLRHLHMENVTAAYELIVVHNPSSPNQLLTLPRLNHVRVIELATNRGYVGGMNAGIDLALKRSPEFVLLLTHDVRIAAGDTQNLLSIMRKNADLGAIGPILCESTSVAYSAGFIRHNRIRMRHRLPADEMPRPIWTCAAIDGSAMMWRATALDEVGGFDERFFMYFEDVDICTRAARCGWRVAVATEVHAISAPGKSSRRTAHAYLRARNGLAYSRTFGWAGLVKGLAECAVGLWHETPKPGGERFGDPEARQLAVKYWRGTVLGVFDYFRGRWGPPPPSVLRDSDIAATSM